MHAIIYTNTHTHRILRHVMSLAAVITDNQQLLDFGGSSELCSMANWGNRPEEVLDSYDMDDITQQFACFVALYAVWPLATNTLFHIRTLLK